MAYASRADLLSPANGHRRYIDVTLPVCGLTVRIQSLSELQKSTYEADLFDSKGKRVAARVVDSRARLIVMCAVDESGKPLFSDADVAAIMGSDGRDVQTLFDALWEHVGFDRTDLAQLAKN